MKVAGRAAAALVAIAALPPTVLALASARGELFPLSPDGPTRARMALIATCALLIAAPLGALRPSSRLSRTPWRFLHAYLAW